MTTPDGTTQEDAAEAAENREPETPAVIIKRDGEQVPFDSKKIFSAIKRAGEATGEFSEQEAWLLTAQVIKVLRHRFDKEAPNWNRFRMLWNRF